MGWGAVLPLGWASQVPLLARHLSLGAWGVGWCGDRNRGVFFGGGAVPGSPQMLLFWAAPSCQRPFSHSGSPHSEDFSSCAVSDLASSARVSSLGSRSQHRLLSSECAQGPGGIPALWLQAQVSVTLSPRGAGAGGAVPRHTRCLLLPGDLPFLKCLPGGWAPPPQRSVSNCPGLIVCFTCASGRGLPWALGLLLEGNGFPQFGRMQTSGVNLLWFGAFIIHHRPHSLEESLL